MESEREEILRVYAGSCEDGIAQMEVCLLELEQHPSRSETLNEAFRICHTIKGDSRTVGFDAAGALAHIIEEVFDRFREGAREPEAALITHLLAAVDALSEVIQSSLADDAPDEDSIARLIAHHQRNLDVADASEHSDSTEPEELSEGTESDLEFRSALGDSRGEALLDRRRGSLRIQIDVLDRMLDLTGELAIARSCMGRLLADDGSASRSALMEAHREMDPLFSELQEEVMRARMVPVGPVFRQHLRVVRDLALSAGKRAGLEIHGADAELDTTVVEHVRTCLGHVIRNSIAHGIESPEERSAAGKDPCGRIALNAWHEGGNIMVEVSDDGGGLDLDLILGRAREMGLVAPDATPTDDQIADFAFTAGFSTRPTADGVSGRGVGLDVVRESLESLGGSVRVTSQRGEGTHVTLRLPLTLAIIDGFEVAVGSEIYVIPLAAVAECLDLPRKEGDWNSGTGVINLRGRALPYARLRDLLGIDETPPERERIVVVRDQGVEAGVAVDALLGESQAVIKPLGKMFREMPGISGSTIRANGDVALILDIPELLQALSFGVGRVDGEERIVNRPKHLSAP